MSGPRASGTVAPRGTLLAVVAVLLLLIAWALRDLLVLVTLALLLAYVLDPVVCAVERLRLPRGLRVPRGLAAGAVMLTLVVALVWLLAIGAPRLAAEFGGFIQRIPETLGRLVVQVRAYGASHGLGEYVDPALDGLRRNAPELLQRGAGTFAGWIGRLFGTLGHLLGLVLLPLLAFYLLAEREAVLESALGFVPEEARERLRVAGRAVERALRSYVRGQGVVCLIMGATTGVALAVIGFPLAYLLGVVVGVAEIVPYLGFAVAAAAIALTGYGVSPFHAVLGVALYAVINNLIGYIVTPRVMGRHLKLHPFVVTLSVLAGAQLLGPAGVLLALPGAAVAQALITEFAPRREAAAGAGER